MTSRTVIKEIVSRALNYKGGWTLLRFGEGHAMRRFGGGSEIRICEQKNSKRFTVTGGWGETAFSETVPINSDLITNAIMRHAPGKVTYVHWNGHYTRINNAGKQIDEPPNHPVMRYPTRYIPPPATPILQCRGMSVSMYGIHSRSHKERIKRTMGAVPVRFRAAFPSALLRKKVRSSLSVCAYVNTIVELLGDEEAKMNSVIVRNNTQILAVAVYEVFPSSPVLTLQFLCSSKTCRGAGSLAMAAIEAVAHALGKTRVEFTQNRRANGFYTKLGYGYEKQSNGTNNLNSRYKHIQRPFEKIYDLGTTKKMLRPGTKHQEY